MMRETGHERGGEEEENQNLVSPAEPQAGRLGTKAWNRLEFSCIHTNHSM